MTTAAPGPPGRAVRSVSGVGGPAERVGHRRCRPSHRSAAGRPPDGAPGGHPNCASSPPPLRHATANRDRVARDGAQRGQNGDRGNAVIEFVFLGVLLLAPLLYLVLAVSAVQRNLYGVTQAAREAGRAYATGTAANAAARAGYAARLALEDQGVPVDGAVIRYGPAGADCAAASTDPPPLTPGGDFAVCVSRPFTIPGVPRFLVGGRSSVTGRYVVHLDQYRDYGDVTGAP